MAIWRGLWDQDLWGRHNATQNGCGSANNGASILHYILFFKADVGNLNNFFESKFNWSPEVDKNTKKECMDGISRIKEDVAKNGLIITAEMNNAMKVGGQAELHFKIPYNTIRTGGDSHSWVSHCWVESEIREIVKQQAHDIRFLENDSQNKKLKGLVYTLSRYGAISYYLNKGCFYNQRSSLSNRIIYISFFVMPTGEKDSLVVISHEELDYRKVWLYYESRFREYKNTQVLTASVKSAIGSIMSRNGSHNIGSHVLAALSHNVGTMPDDRVLYQYIQHRMDYIATATTEFPIWKQSTKIVGDVFKTFLSQYHLLNYISGSEGLKAYQFQNPNIDLSTAEQGGTIRVHIRRIDDEDDGWTQSNLFVPGTTGKPPVDFIVYPAGKELRLDKDVEIAIPGGVIGQHAIYTIIENILRNAAKHEWSNLDKEEKEKCHLDLFVDFKDRPVDGVVEFVVWTCNEKSPTERAHGIESDISVSDIYEKLVNEDKGAKLDLAGLLPHQQLQVKVSRPFISSNGQLHKENWGLAEMRISAGFLNTVDIGEIGGVNCTGADGRQYVEKCLRLIKPVMVEGEIPIEQHEKGQRKTIKSSRKAKQGRGKKCYSLGYNFVIPKPKELLVIIPDEVVKVSKEEFSCDEKTLSSDDIEAVHKKLRRFGVGVITESELKSPDADITYSYVLAREIAGELQELTNGEKGWVCHEEFLKLPFRVLSARGNRPSNQKGTWVGEYTGNLYVSNEELAKTLKAILSDDFNVEVFVQKLKIGVCRDWLSHIKMQRGFSFSDIPIVIDMYGDSGNSGQSLVTDSDLLKVVFQNCFNAAVKSFFEMWLAEEYVEPINGDEVVRKYIQDVKCVRTVLAILLVMCPRQLEESTGRSKSQARTRELIQNQLGGWCREASNKIKDGTLENWVSAYYSQRNGDEKDKMPAMLRKVLDKLRNAEGATVARNATNCLKVAEQWFAGDDQSVNAIPFLGEFIKYLEKTILEQARVFLSKYEERHVTLPCCFAASEYKKDQDTSLYAFSGQEKHKDAQEIQFTSDEDKKNKIGRRAIAYWRHETFKLERAAPPFYLEPLSGAQSYFNSFVQLANEFNNYKDASNAKFGHSIVKLVETGLFRVLLIDERVTKFISEHANVAKTFEHIGVNAIDDNSDATKKLFDSIEPSKIVIDDRGTTISDFEILIIHQGIIDKLLSGHEDPANVKNFICHIVEEVKYVIITTGRGSPANIPPTARVLPFSVIENTLFKNYPEKMILLDAVMNVLPDCNTKKKDEGKKEVST